MVSYMDRISDCPRCGKERWADTTHVCPSVCVKCGIVVDDTEHAVSDGKGNIWHSKCECRPFDGIQDANIIRKNKPLSFEDLRFANVQRNKEWDPNNQLTASFRGLELSGELGEMIEKAFALIECAIVVGKITNIVKKIERERIGLKGSRVSMLDLADELADAQICLDLTAMQYSIDLGEATRRKFNATSDKVGLKTKL
jgi:hypothetical protein